MYGAELRVSEGDTGGGGDSINVCQSILVSFLRLIDELVPPPEPRHRRLNCKPNGNETKNVESPTMIQ